MLTRFGSKIYPIRSTGGGWMIVTRDQGRRDDNPATLREWHITEMHIEGTETDEEVAVIEEAMKEASEAVKDKADEVHA